MVELSEFQRKLYEDWRKLFGISAKERAAMKEGPPTIEPYKPTEDNAGSE